MGRFQSLIAYDKAFSLAMDIFRVNKKFPKEETYSLVDQYRKSSRSVCACLAEAYRKRPYPAHFVSKASDADMENAETSVWTSFSFNCGYLNEPEYDFG